MNKYLASPIRIRQLLGVTLAAVLACLSASALAGMESPQDTAAVRAVKLDMDLVRRLSTAANELQKLPQSPRPQHDDDDDEGGRAARHADPVDSMAAKINAQPGARTILASHRLDARRFSLGVLAVANCALVAALAESGNTPSADDLKRASVTPANERFCQTHLAEITELVK